MNSKSRAGIFDSEDLSDFAPTPPVADAKPEVVRAVAEAASFRSREPQKARVSPVQVPKREPRRFRTGRNVQLNLKVRQEAADAFYALADQLEIVLGEAFERAVLALQREIDNSNSQVASR